MGLLLLVTATVAGCSPSVPGRSVAASSPPAATSSAVQDYGNGQAAANGGRCDRAIPFYLSAIMKNPLYVSAYSGLGFCYQQIGSPNAAIVEYDRAIQIDPTNYGLYIARAGAEFQNGSAGAALADDTIAVGLAPRQSPTYVSIADSFSSFADFADAITTINKAIALVPGDPSLYEKRAGYYVLAHDYGHAYADYHTAVKVAPFLASRASIYSDLANVYDQQGDFPSALRAIDTAIPLQPTNAQLYLQSATIHQHAGDLAGALALYDHVLHQPGAQGNAETVYEGRGDVLSAMGKTQAALAAYTHALRLTNKHNPYDATFIRPRLQGKIKALQSGQS